MPRWPEPEEAAPRIETLRAIDPSGVHCPIVLVGDGSAAALEAMAREVDREVVWTEDGFFYYRLAIGPLRGIAATVHVYAPFDARFKGFLPHTRWLAIASQGPHRDPSWTKWVDQLTRVLAIRSEIVVGLCGDAELVDGWKTSGGREPVVTAATLAPVIKGLARHFLTTARS